MWNIFKKKLEPEAYFAYLNRLPNNIKVGWKRSNNGIVGIVKIDKFSFGVQAKNADEFVNAVNEGLLVAYDTPEEYLTVLLENKKFIPAQEDWDRLKEGEPNSSDLVFRQDKKVDKLIVA